MLQLKSKFISDDGSFVDYGAMGKSEDFKNYLRLANSLESFDWNPLKRDEMERKAFFINLYNVQMIHGLIAQSDLPDGPLKVQVFFSFHFRTEKI